MPSYTNKPTGWNLEHVKTTPSGHLMPDSAEAWRAVLDAAGLQHMPNPSSYPMQEPAMKKIVKIVHHNEVEDLTRNGWVLVATYENTQHVVEKKTLKQPSYNAGNHYVPESFEVSHHLVTAPLFALEKDFEGFTREEKLDLRLAECDHERCRALGDLKEVQTANEALQKQIARLDTDLQRAYAARDQQTRDARTAEDRSRKLEADLAKARREVGEARWREITGS